MKVLHIVNSLELGGLERLVVDMCHFSRIANGTESIICCLKDSESLLTKKARENSVKIFSLSQNTQMNKLDALSKLISCIRREGIEIIHSHNSSPHIYGALAAKFTGRPLIHTKHGNQLPFKNIKGLFLNRIAAAFTDKIVAVSKNVEEHVISGYRVSSDKVTTIVNGIDINSYNVTKQISEGCNDKKYKLLFSIGCVGRLAVEKDHSTLLKSLLIISNVFSNIRLTIAGDGVLSSFLQEETRKLGLDDRVSFLGSREEIPEILQKFDVFVQPSLTEGLSLTLLEAMATSLPIVATNVGGNPEVVVDGVTGFLVPPKAPEKMAEAIIKILQNPDLAKKMGEAGRKRVEQRFGLDRMVKEYEDLYEECLRKKGYRV